MQVTSRKIYLGVITIVIIIAIVLFFTLFKGCYKPDTDYKGDIALKELEISLIKKQRVEDSLQLLKKDSLIDVYQKQIQVRDYFIRQNKIKIHQLDKEINSIPDRVRRLSKDSLRSAAIN